MASNEDQREDSNRTESLPTGSSTGLANTVATSPTSHHERQGSESYRGQHDLDNATRLLFEQTPSINPSLPPHSRATTTIPETARPITEQPIRKRAAIGEESRSSLSNLEFNLVVPLITLGETITEKEVIAFRDQARARPGLVTEDVIQGKARIIVGYRIMGDASQVYVEEDQIEEWYKHVSIGQASEIICRYFSNPKTTSDRPIAEVISQLPFRLNFAKQEVEEETLYQIAATLDKYYDSHPQENATTQNELAMIIEKKLPQNSQLLSDYLQKKRKEMGFEQVDTPSKVIKRIKQCMGFVRALRSSVDRYGPFDTTYAAHMKSNLREGGNNPATRLETDNTTQCNTCGHTTHTQGDCPHKQAPDTNRSTASWGDSAVGERWKNAGYNSFQNHVTLSLAPLATEKKHREPFDHNDPENIKIKAGHKLEKERKRQEYENRQRQQNQQQWGQNNFNQLPPPYNQYGGLNNQPNGGWNNQNQGNQGNGKQQKGTPPGDYGKDTTTISTITEKTLPSDFLLTRIFLQQQIKRASAEAKDHSPLTQAPEDSVTAQTLLDTGALGGNFLSGNMVTRLRGEKFVYQTKSGIVVCSGLDNSCYTSTDMIDIGVEFLADSNITKIILINTRISPYSKVDLIIGRPTIKKHNFWKWTPSHFSAEPTEVTNSPTNPLTRRVDNTPSWMITHPTENRDIQPEPHQRVETQSS